MEIPAGAIENTSGSRPGEQCLPVQLHCVAAAGSDRDHPAAQAGVNPGINTITATFNQAIAQGTNFSGINIQDRGVTGTVYAPFSLPSSSLSVSGDTLTISLPQTLADDTFYQVTIPAGAIDDTSGNPLAADYDFGFTTEFVAVSTNPPDNATGVSIDSPITITFSNVVAAGPPSARSACIPPVLPVRR